MQITIDGEKFELNVEKAKELKLLTPIVTYRIGQRFKTGGEEYILGQSLAKMIALISLQNGNRWIDAVTVNNAHKITSEEFALISQAGKFELIS